MIGKAMRSMVAVLLLGAGIAIAAPTIAPRIADAHGAVAGSDASIVQTQQRLIAEQAGRFASTLEEIADPALALGLEPGALPSASFSGERSYVVTADGSAFVHAQSGEDGSVRLIAGSLAGEPSFSELIHCASYTSECVARVTSSVELQQVSPNWAISSIAVGASS